MPTPMGRKHTTLGKVLHWGFLVLYAYGIFKQIDDLSELEDTALLLFEIAFATLFLVIVILRYAYMRRFETFQGATVPVSAVHKKSARAIHVAMYLCLALLPLTGLAIAALYTQGVGEEALAMDAMISLHGLCPHRDSCAGSIVFPRKRRRRLDVHGSGLHRNRAEREPLRSQTHCDGAQGGRQSRGVHRFSKEVNFTKRP